MHYKLLFSSLFLLFILFLAIPSQAQEGEAMKFTVTPLLVKNNMSQGEKWSSTIKLINNTLEPITLYAEVMDFKSREDGQGPEFIYTQEEKEKYNQYLLSQWIAISKEPIIIGPQQSIQVPYSIEVPENSGPGGHYAAILFGNKPEQKEKGTYIKTSSQIASLFMVNIKGEVIERGSIREFSSVEDYYQAPTAKLKVKFENKGNVHIQPQGEIRISNMWGREAGKILINHQTEFGNVLPESTRVWEFDWQGKEGIQSMGRYKADLILTFGNEGKESVFSSVYFWYINFKTVGIILGAILIIILIIYIFVKRSVNKAIKLAQSISGASQDMGQPQKIILENKIIKNSEKNNQTPIDLRQKNNSNLGPKKRV